MKWPALEAELSALKQKDLYREPALIGGRLGGRLRSRGREYLDFSSNDYLGLSTEPSVMASAERAVRQYGAGSGASRLVSGSLEIHAVLERALASFKREEAALVFSSGYMAALGAVSALLNQEDLVLVDRLDHASLIDAARLSRAKFEVYPHADVDALDRLLARSEKRYRRKLVITDAYFSMDGRVAPLKELLERCERHGALLMIDEAHSTGVYGKSGRGLTEHFGLAGKVPVVMGTLSKALGSAGGFIAGDRTMIDMLVNRARSFIYTTAPAPAASGAALASLRLIEKNATRTKKLWQNIRDARERLTALGLDLGGSEGPVIPVMVRDTARTLRLSRQLRSCGIFAPAIRPPTVPKDTDRIRLSISASHSAEDIGRLADSLKNAKKRSL